MKYPSLEAALYSRVDFSGECWLWTAGKTNGYGQFRFHRKFWYAHITSYALQHGPVPKGLTIDHLCRTRACIRPLHLEAVTLEENKRRGMSANAVNARKTQCKRGHPLHGANLLRTSRGNRWCRECKQAADRAYHARRRLVVAA